MLLRFCQWLAETPWSIRIHESLWGYPLLESAHVWALALFVGFAVLLDLRLLGWAMPRVPVSEVARRLLPWTRAGFVIMVATGFLLFYAIPVRSYQNIFFRVKIVLLLLAGLNAFLFHAGIFKRVASWDAQHPAAAARQVRRRRVAPAVGVDHLRRPHDRLQLVRLRSSAAAGVGQLGRRLRGGVFRLDHDFG